MLAPFSNTKSTQVAGNLIVTNRKTQPAFVVIALLVLIPALVAPCRGQSGKADFQSLAAHFDYPERLGLDFTEMGVEQRGKALVIDLQ